MNFAEAIEHKDHLNLVRVESEKELSLQKWKEVNARLAKAFRHAKGVDQ